MLRLMSGPGSALDKEARKRGNSVYFPDRVVPMLPERISNDLCSLIENEPRACLAVRMIFDKDGRKLSHRFFRALMRSAASLTYEQAQAAIDGRVDEITGPLLDTVLRPLWGAYASLVLARTERGPLELDLPERKILLDDKGRVRGVASPPRLDAHRLIEEFMIAANVAAAETLEAKRSPLIYRVHDSPSKEKLAALGEFLNTIGIKLPKSGTLKPAQFNRILADTRATPTAELVGEVILQEPGPGRIQAGKFRPFRLEPAPLRAFHLADPPLCRSHRPSRAGAGARRRDDGLTDAEMGELGEIAQQHLRHRAPGHGGRAGDGRPPDRRLSCRPHRREVPGARLGPGPHRPVRQADRDRRRRLRPGLVDRPRIFLPRRGAAGAGRRGHAGSPTGSATRSRCGWSRRSRAPARSGSRC